MTAGVRPIPGPVPRRRRRQAIRILGGTLWDWLLAWLLVSVMIALLWGAL